MRLVDPIEAIREDGYYAPCPHPEMKTTDKTWQGLSLVLVNEYLDTLGQVRGAQESYETLHDLAYRWLMRDEQLRQEMVENRERVLGKRLGTVNIWDSILMNLVESLEDSLEHLAPEGYYFGMPYEEAGWQGFYPLWFLDAPDGGVEAYEEFMQSKREERKV